MRELGKPLRAVHPVAETAKIRTGLDAVCWHCLQESNFWAEWCPEIRRPLWRCHRPGHPLPECTPWLRQ